MQTLNWKQIGDIQKVLTQTVPGLLEEGSANASFAYSLVSVLYP